METTKQTLDRHIKVFYDKNKLARFDDIPESVFYSAMEDYANSKLSNIKKIIEDRISTIKSEPNGIVRETMIDNLLIDI